VHHPIPKITIFRIWLVPLLVFFAKAGIFVAVGVGVYGALKKF
jgi:hypothetical protein